MRGACRRNGCQGAAPLAHGEAGHQDGRQARREVAHHHQAARLRRPGCNRTTHQDIREYALWVVCEMGMVQRGDWEQIYTLWQSCQCWPTLVVERRLPATSPAGAGLACGRLPPIFHPTVDRGTRAAPAASMPGS